MRNWRPSHIALIWLGWTAILVMAYLALMYSNIFASVNIAPPMPTSVGVGGRRFAVPIALGFAIVWAFFWLYLPPILLTLSWLVARRKRAAS